MVETQENASNEEVMLLSSPLVFDPSVVQMFATFYKGQQLLLLSRLVMMDHVLLLEALVRHRVTVLQGNPSVLVVFGVCPTTADRWSHRRDHLCFGVSDAVLPVEDPCTAPASAACGKPLCEGAHLWR